MIKEKFSQSCSDKIQLGLQGGQVPGIQIMVSGPGGPPPSGHPPTYSLECMSPDCTLGENVGRYKTPEYPQELARKLLVMHDNTTTSIRGLHRWWSPVRTARQRKLTGWPLRCQLTNVIDTRDQLLACCETDLRRDLHRYLGTRGGNKTEVKLLAEIKKIAVVTRRTKSMLSP